jgi:hypothetical protein
VRSAQKKQQTHSSSNVNASVWNRCKVTRHLGRFSSLATVALRVDIFGLGGVCQRYMECGILGVIFGSF